MFCPIGICLCSLCVCVWVCVCLVLSAQTPVFCLLFGFPPRLKLSICMRPCQKPLRSRPRLKYSMPPDEPLIRIYWGKTTNIYRAIAGFWHSKHTVLRYIKGTVHPNMTIQSPNNDDNNKKKDYSIIGLCTHFRFFNTGRIKMRVNRYPLITPPHSI